MFPRNHLVFALITQTFNPEPSIMRQINPGSHRCTSNTCRFISNKTPHSASLRTQSDNSQASDSVIASWNHYFPILFEHFLQFLSSPGNLAVQEIKLRVNVNVAASKFQKMKNWCRQIPLMYELWETQVVSGERQKKLWLLFEILECYCK